MRRERAPLADRLRARAADRPDLQRSQAAMRGLLMVERGAAAEIAGLDERDAEATACRLVRRGQAVNAAADHEQVELRSTRARQRSRARMEALLSYSRAPCHLRSRPPLPTSASTGTGTFTISKSRRTRSARRASSPISISITSRSCITCCGSSTSTATAAGRCSKSAAARAPTSARFASGGAHRLRRRSVAVRDRAGAAELRAAGAAGRFARSRRRAPAVCRRRVRSGLRPRRRPVHARSAARSSTSAAAC